jgi:hypothetical protein
MRKLSWASAIFVIAMVATPALAQQRKNPVDSNIGIKDLVHECVHYVRHMPNPNPIYGDSYKHFDAFYNGASGKVENNAFLNVDQQALYVFRECMAEHNYPLR